ncbi:fimbrial biogenesis chaperone [Deinococcus depolymerans]|uniref:Pili assembly chaperone N-terminal domain-containing protein n=1 Tax=Deinococcus depolymerans TaxID=392408 RepID=A0ABN1BP82_9DEIO
MIRFRSEGSASRSSTGRRFLQATLLGLLTLGPAVSAQGAGSFSLSVSPTTLNLAPGARTVSVTVSNSGTQPVTFSAQLMGWTQSGTDALTPTPDMIVAPAQLTLPAGGRQVLRLARLGTPPTTQRAYRLLLTQQPTAGATGVQTLLRLSVPLFDGPRGEAQVKAGQLGRVLTLRNVGSGHAKLGALEAQLAGRWVPLGLTYVLPGTQRSLTLPAEGAVTGLRYTDEDGRLQSLPIDPVRP